MRTSLILVLGLLLQATPKEWIDKLHSDRVEDRDAASRELKKLDASALPLLEAAAKDPDPEVSRRAGLAMRIIRLRESLTPGLRKALPGLEERLASGTDAAYTAAFLELADRAEIPTADLEPLAVRALRGATDRERSDVLSFLYTRRLTLAVPEIRPFLRSEVPGIALQAESTLTALAPQAAREAFLELTRERTPQLRIRGIAALERGRMHDELPRIAALLSDPDASVRSTAISALGSMGARSEIPRIVARVSDPDNGVQIRAIQTLLVLDAKEALPLLLDLARKPPGIADQQLISLLTGLDAVDAGPVIAERLASKNSGIRTAAARALGDLGAADQAGRVLPLLGDEDEEVRAAALWVVGRLGLREAADRVVKLLTDEDSDVRTAAAWAVGKLRVTAAVPDLIRMLADNKRDFAVPAAWALGELRAKEALPRLLELALETGELGHSAAEAIGAIGEPLTLPQLLQLLESTNDRIPYALEPAIRAIPKAELLAALLRKVADEEPIKHQLALRHIGALRLSDGVPALLKVLRDVNQLPWDRMLAARSLAQLSRKEIGQDLLALVKDGNNWPYRGEAVHLLGLLEGRDLLPWIKGFLKDPSSDVGLAAVRTLEELGATELLDSVLPFLGDQDDTLGVVSAAWLCRSGRREGVEALLREGEPLSPINGVRNPAGWKKLAAVRVEGILRGSRLDIAERIAREAGLRLAWTWSDVDITTRLEQRLPFTDPAPKSGTAVLEAIVRASEGDYCFIVEDDVLRVLPLSRAHQVLRNWYESTKPR